jgi:hypothetical protein
LKNNDQLFTRLAYGIILSAAILRIIVFFQNRSLFIDEASLGTQIIDKSFPGLFGNFVDQFVPPLFCVIVKSATELFGNTEYALRLFSLICGLFSLFLFYEFCKTFLEPKHVIFPILLFGFSMFMVQYSTEVKQYSTDVAFALGILLLSLKISPRTIQNQHFILWIILGIVSIWFSMPAVFMLFGVGIYYGISFLKVKNWNKFLFLSFVVIAWLFSFGIYFFTIIQNDLGIEKLENYHSPFFIPLPPTSLADFKKIGNILLSFYQTAIGATFFAIAWGILSTIFGIYALFKKDKMIAWLLILPILAAMFASGLQYYSLLPRLTLFFIPILVLFIGLGTQLLLSRSSNALQWLIIIVMAINVINQKGFHYYFQRFEIEELRPVLNYVNKHSSSEDLKYIHFQAENAYVFYSQFYNFKEECYLENAVQGLWSDRVSELLIERKEPKIWLIFSHFKEKEINDILSKFKDKIIIKESFQKTGASCYLLEKTEIE